VPPPIEDAEVEAIVKPVQFFSTIVLPDVTVKMPVSGVAVAYDNEKGTSSPLSTMSRPVVLTI